ncbi:MAG TPA: hypothetical protein VKK31_04125 [Thermoanaerobaculia bacterium]|nr:hypothetical protein [Thermoanaerobaculia bacterium]
MKKARKPELVNVRETPAGAVIVTERTRDGKCVERVFEGQVPQKYLERLPAWNEFE